MLCVCMCFCVYLSVQYVCVLYVCVYTVCVQTRGCVGVYIRIYVNVCTCMHNVSTNCDIMVHNVVL